MSAPDAAHRSLADIVATLAGAPPDEAWLLDLLAGLARGLHELHAAHRLHLGITPAQVWRGPQGWKLLPGRGTEPGFAAPEQGAADATMNEGPWSDIYALAALVRFAVTGRAPQPAIERAQHDAEAPLSEMAAGRYSARFLRAIDRAWVLLPDHRTPDLAHLCSDLGLPAPGHAGAHALPPAPDGDEVRVMVRPPSAQAEPPPLRAAPGGLLGELLNAPAAVIAGAWNALRGRPPPHPGRPWNHTIAPPPDSADEPLRFGLSTPVRAAAGEEFVLAFMAYVDSLREASLQQVQAFVGNDHRQLMDLVPDGTAVWRRGTPFTVRVTGRAFDVEPAEQGFEWNGRRHILNFALRVRPGASGKALLGVLVSVAGVAVCSFTRTVELGAPAAAAEALQVHGSAPRSVFASYASKDAVDVAARLSTLARWAPGLDIFQDCLDLKPGEAFKPQLAGQIAARDAFLLFWSRHAAASNWVRWEMETALASKPAEAILPMPLEDPALAPPPQQLQALHFRDRYLLAGYAAQAIAAAAAGPGAAPQG